MNSRLLFALGFSLAIAAAKNVSAETVWLDQLDVRSAVQGYGEPHKNKSVEGNPLTIGGKVFQRGFGTHAESILHINLGGGAQKFTASVGVNDEVNGNAASSVEFFVIGDGKTLWSSGVLHAGNAAKECAVDLSGVKELTLKVGDAGDGMDWDHADWADAKFETAAVKTFATSGEALPEPVAPYILTPPAPAAPRINGANVFGVRPGSPFLFTIPATGERPMEFSIKNAPPSLGIATNQHTIFQGEFSGMLYLNPTNGQITGQFLNKGEFTVTLVAKNSLGTAEKKFRIVVGDQIALTPPMGWNSWNCFAHAVSADRVKRAADAMVKSGLINHGWTYINIDDYWENHRPTKDPALQDLLQPFRDKDGFIQPNARFPDMKGLADYVHGLGLKIGLYSSPGPLTCGGCAASWKHEQQDAQTYAKWGFDYLKYDWCSYGEIASGGNPDAKDIPTWGKTAKDDAGAIYPYQVMGTFLREQNRDIVFSLCQYGMADVWKWGGSVQGNCWRTTGDITDTWKSMTGIGFKQDKAAPYAKPGNWNDPDMLIVGEVGWGKTHPTRLTPDEQYTHISLWCLLAAPLLIGCDMETFDDFTLNLLSNDEVLAIDQDELGKEATCVINNGNLRIYARDLADGGRAVGFFNLGRTPEKLDFTDFVKLNLSGKQTARDLWRQQNVATVDTTKESLPLTIPAHGVVLYKFTAVK